MTEPTPPTLEAIACQLWEAAKPGREAQAIRSAISLSFGDADLPEYVWDLLDVAAQRARAEALEEAVQIAQRYIDNPCSAEKNNTLCAFEVGIDHRTGCIDNALAIKHAIRALIQPVPENKPAAQPAPERWQPIATAPRDGTKVLLAKIVGHIDHPTAIWWVVQGFWSDKWHNWNDGIEPSGLAGPTHWMSVPRALAPRQRSCKTTGGPGSERTDISSGYRRCAPDYRSA